MLPLRFLVAALCVMLAPWAQAQEWPARGPIRFIVAWPPGGLNDLLARSYNDRVSQAIGQSMVLMNRPGAGGVIGTTEAAKSPPDGYTLAMGTLGPLTIAPHLRRDLQYSTQSFEPVAMLALSPLVLVVTDGMPAKSLRELVALAKARPASLNFAGMGGVGTTQHLAFELFKQAAGIDITTIPFKGTGDAMPALISGQVEVALDTLGPLLPLIRSGKLRALAVTTSERVKQLPDVPTLAELGYGSVSSFTWHVVLAPAGTPPAILDRLEAEYAKAARDPAIQRLLEEQVLVYQPSNRVQLAQRIHAESETRKKIIADRGIKLD